MAKAQQIGPDTGPGGTLGPDPVLAPRLACAAGLAVLLSLNVGWPAGAVWLMATLVGEAMVVATGRPFARLSQPPLWLEWAHGASVFGQTTIWTVPAAMLWTTGRPALMAAAIGLLAVQMFYAVGFTYRTALSLFLCGAPPVGMVAALALFFTRAAPVEHVTLVFGVTLAVGFAALVAHANFSMLRDLKRAQADLAGQTEAAEAASAAKSAFLAQMSHELRTPMNGVIGMGHVLRGTSLSADQSRYVDMLLRSGDGLMALLNDILDLSKIEAGRLDLAPEPFDIQDLAGQVAQTWTELASAKGVALRVDCADGAPRWLYGDGLRVRQIMQNLLSNAVKFTDRGEIVLSIDGPAKGPGVMIAVRDTGAGIDDATQSRLFSAFTQADASIARRHGGTGLGLSICRHLARLMNGDVSLESRPGEETRFCVTLPLPEADAQAAPVAGSEGPDFDGLRVLVVDDNRINLTVASTILSAAGIAVTAAADGREALEQLRDGRFDLVLMDVHMPVMGGVEAMQRVRRGEAGPRDLPIIALTADAMSGERERLTALGFDDLHPKPIAPAALFGAIDRVLKSAPAPGERLAATAS